MCRGCLVVIYTTTPTPTIFLIMVVFIIRWVGWCTQSYYTLRQKIYSLAFFILPTNLSVFTALQLVYFFIVYLDNFFKNWDLKSSNAHIFFLKFNSDNNILLILYVGVVLYYILGTNSCCYVYPLSAVLLFIEVFIKQLNLNTNSILVELESFRLSTDLTNGLLLIHPLCLYSAFGLVGLNCYLQLKYFRSSNLYLTNISRKQLNMTLNTVFLLLISVFLGCWWAQLELSWGGWWGWDFVEIVSLNYLLIICLILHGLKNYISYHNFLIDFFFKMVLFTFLIKFGYIDSIHNFTSTETFLQHFFELLVAYFYILFVYFTVKIFIKNSHLNSKSWNLMTIVFLIYCVFLYLYIVQEFLSALCINSSVDEYFLKNKYIFIGTLTIMVIYLITTTEGLFMFNPLMLTLSEFFYLKLVNKNMFNDNRTYLLHGLVYSCLFILQFNDFFYYGSCVTCYLKSQLDFIIGDFNYLYSNHQQTLSFNDGQTLLFNDRVVLDKIVRADARSTNLFEYKTDDTFVRILLSNLEIFFIYTLFTFSILYLIKSSRLNYLF